MWWSLKSPSIRHQPITGGTFLEVAYKLWFELSLHVYHAMDSLAAHCSRTSDHSRKIESIVENTTGHELSYP